GREKGLEGRPGGVSPGVEEHARDEPGGEDRRQEITGPADPRIPVHPGRRTRHAHFSSGHTYCPHHFLEDVPLGELGAAMSVEQRQSLDDRSRRAGPRRLIAWTMYR